MASTFTDKGDANGRYPCLITLEANHVRIEPIGETILDPCAILVPLAHCSWIEAPLQPTKPKLAKVATEA